MTMWLQNTFRKIDFVKDLSEQRKIKEQKSQTKLKNFGLSNPLEVLENDRRKEEHERNSRRC